MRSRVSGLQFPLETARKVSVSKIASRLYDPSKEATQLCAVFIDGAAF